MNRKKNITPFDPNAPDPRLPAKSDGPAKMTFKKAEGFDPKDLPEFKAPSVPYFKPPFSYKAPTFKEAGDLKALVQLIAEITDGLKPAKRFKDGRESFEAPVTGRFERPEGPKYFDVEKEWQEFAAYFARLAGMTRYSSEGLIRRPKKAMKLGTHLVFSEEVQDYLDAKPMIWLDVNVSLTPDVQGTLLMRRATPHNAEGAVEYEIKSDQYLIMRRHPFVLPLERKQLTPIFIIHHDPETGRIHPIPGFMRNKDFLSADLLGLMQQVHQESAALSGDPLADFRFSEVLKFSRRGLMNLQLDSIFIQMKEKPKVEGRVSVMQGEAEVDLFVHTPSTGPFEKGMRVRANRRELHGEAIVRIKIEQLMGRVKAVCFQKDIRILPLFEDGIVELNGTVGPFSVQGLEARMGAKANVEVRSGGILIHELAEKNVPAQVISDLDTLGASSFGGKSGEEWLQNRFETTAGFFLKGVYDFLDVENKWWSTAFNDRDPASLAEEQLENT